MWTTIEPAPDVQGHYRAQGWWDGQTLPVLLGHALARSGRATFRVHSQDRPWRGTVADVTDLGRRLAAGLTRRGIQTSDTVAFTLPNSAQAAAVFYGLVLAGATLVPVSHTAGQRDLDHALRESGARALLVWHTREKPYAFDALTRSALPKLELVVAIGDASAPTDVIDFNDVVNGPAIDEPATVDPAQPAVIGWTSGTTGAPKGVLLSHRALCAETRAHMSPMMSARSRPLASTSPIAHVTGMLVSVLVPPLLGQQIHLLDYWDAGEVLDLMSAEALSAGTGAPLFLASLLDHPACRPAHHELIEMSSLGGAAVPAELVLRAQQCGIVAMRGYGCTEHPSISLGMRDDPTRKRAHTDGRLCAGVEVRIVDDDGRRVPTGGHGEILSRGPDLFSGYTDAGLNADAFDQGWYRTGDIGWLDEAGYLSVVDRKKDIVIRAGMNISPAEIEAAMTSMPQVAGVAVIAVPDARTGERACAFVQPASGQPTLDDVRQHLSILGLAKYKWPEEVVCLVEDFPRTPAGKVRKTELRAVWAAHHHEGNNATQT
ncbi:long-chain-fatty-acid--CoA ligase [Mycobacterium gallinarum]|uniref:Long-chain-fatty-acid--CoA ligase n=2 Tax=Mycobacterium gallinarum TaxID=39689 RepID=A0A9W4FFQ0_9MYCO|nr:long-chain-fatty-acid--CoA ligase [Mycobacterium gallinarum]